MLLRTSMMIVTRRTARAVPGIVSHLSVGQSWKGCRRVNT